MLNPLILKLEHGTHLTPEDRAELEKICSHTRHVGPREAIIEDGQVPEDVHLVMNGIACREKITPDGRRSIMALLLPGDFCDLHVAILDHMDHSITTLTPCTIVDIPRRIILKLTEHHSRIAHALWWATLADEGVLREWVVNMGSRDANHRVAHFFCELLVRFQAIGWANDNTYDLPLSQQELSDIMAISVVHMNRTLQTLREQKLIVFKDKRLTVLKPARLKHFSGFSPNYLHLSRRASKGRTDVK